MIRYIVLILLLCATSSFAATGESRIYAQRVDDDGSLLSTAFTIYNSASGPQSHAHISFYDDRYLVVWQEFNGTYMDVKAARVEMDGTVLDTTPMNIATGSETQALPDVAADSTGWVVVWHEFDGTDIFPSLFARRVDYDGTYLTNTPVQFGDTNTVGSAPRIAWDSVAGKFLVLFTSYGPSGTRTAVLRWSRLSTTLTAEFTDQYIKLSGNGEAYYELTAMPGASGGWTFTINGGPYIGFSREYPVVTPVHIETTGLLNAGTGSTSDEGSVGSGTEVLDTNYYAWGVSAVAADASYVIAVWPRYSYASSITARELYDGDLYAARVDEYAPVEAVGGTAVSDNDDIGEVNPSLAGDGAGSLLLVYDTDTDGSTEITSRILTVGAPLTSSAEVTIRSDSTGGRRSHSDVAYGVDGATTEFMVVWTEGWWGAL